MRVFRILAENRSGDADGQQHRRRPELDGDSVRDLFFQYSVSFWISSCHVNRLI